MPTQRAFVIQFLPRTSTTPERFEGRVEHVGSGEAAHFSSPPELLDFVSRLLGPPIREVRKARGEPQVRRTPAGSTSQ